MSGLLKGDGITGNRHVGSIGLWRIADGRSSQVFHCYKCEMMMNALRRLLSFMLNGVTGLFFTCNVKSFNIPGACYQVRHVINYGRALCRCLRTPSVTFFLFFVLRFMQKNCCGCFRWLIYLKMRAFVLLKRHKCIVTPCEATG